LGLRKYDNDDNGKEHISRKREPSTKEVEVASLSTTTVVPSLKLDSSSPIKVKETELKSTTDTTAADSISHSPGPSRPSSRPTSARQFLQSSPQKAKQQSLLKKKEQSIMNINITELKKAQYATRHLPELTNDLCNRYFDEKSISAFNVTYQQLKEQGEILVGGYDELHEIMKDDVNSCDDAVEDRDRIAKKRGKRGDVQIRKDNILTFALTTLNEKGLLTPRDKDGNALVPLISRPPLAARKRQERLLTKMQQQRSSSARVSSSSVLPASSSIGTLPRPSSAVSSANSSFSQNNDNPGSPLPSPYLKSNSSANFSSSNNHSSNSNILLKMKSSSAANLTSVPSSSSAHKPPVLSASSSSVVLANIIEDIDISKSPKLRKSKTVGWSSSSASTETILGTGNEIETEELLESECLHLSSSSSRRVSPKGSNHSNTTIAVDKKTLIGKSSFPGEPTSSFNNSFSSSSHQKVEQQQDLPNLSSLPSNGLTSDLSHKPFSSSSSNSFQKKEASAVFSASNLPELRMAQLQEVIGESRDAVTIDETDDALLNDGLHVMNDENDDEFFLHQLSSSSHGLSVSHPSSSSRLDDHSYKDPKMVSSYTPASPRAIFLAGCLRHGLPPRAHVLLRKRISTSINLAHIGIGNQMAKVLADALPSLPYLQAINLSDNNLEDDGLSAIINAIAKHPTIEILDISQNTIDSEAANSLANFIGNADCRLQCLRMSDANIDDGECAAFVEVLMNNRQLKELDMSKNLLGKDENLNAVQPDFTTAGEALSALLKEGLCPIQTLNVCFFLYSVFPVLLSL
jgi:hypothetical protein